MLWLFDLMIPVESPTIEQTPTAATSKTRTLEIATSLLIGVAFFLLLRATPDLPGGFDGYRHVKQASRLLTEPRAMLADPWHLAYFWKSPVDAWFGYHLLLAPFTAVFDLITAAKLLSSIVFASIAYVLFLLLRILNIGHRVGWVLLSLTGSSILLCRATTVRPFLLSVLLTLLAALWTIEDKPVKLALISALHALSYSMFFLPIMAPAVWLLLRRDRRSLIAALSCAAGIALGVLANPYFPQNLRFDIAQASVVQIGLHAHVQIGGELYPVSSWWFIAASLPVMILWVGALVVRMRRRSAPVSDLFLVLSLATFLGSLRVARTTDFFVPFAILFAAFVLSPYLDALRGDLKYVALFLALGCGINIYLTYKYVVASPSVERYRGAAEYLKKQAPQALVADTQWADYYFLFFWNSENRYVIGIEPTFMYLADPKKYWLWQHMSNDEPTTCGREHCADSGRVDIESMVRNDLGAQYVVTEHAANPMLEKVLRSKEVYRDAGFSVFKVN